MGKGKNIYSYCGIKLRSKKLWEEHEKLCKITSEKRNEYKNRLCQVSRNQYCFYAKSVKDVENCMDYLPVVYTTNFDYENYNYPCTVLFEPFNDSDDIGYVSIILLEDYIDKLREVKKTSQTKTNNRKEG